MEFLWPPSSSITRPWIPSEDKVLVKTNQTSPNSMGLCVFIMEFLWPPSSSITRPWIPSEDKVLVKTNQTSPNSMGLCVFIMEFLWPPSSSITRPWIPSEDKVLVKTNQMSPNSMGFPVCARTHQADRDRERPVGTLRANKTGCERAATSDIRRERPLTHRMAHIDFHGGIFSSVLSRYRPACSSRRQRWDFDFDRRRI
ncbi:hypothetical protein EVAR_15070_1 [Eumeta japonica]|uniref:Uncharacterized protein n=1 Tax=Eumeta variegata TaxID=151549 RepID=A0A4C1YHI1_EUMVA|nr:hypothetical protein EVAR_15070_1 [Eumeta japonica]